MNSHWASSTHQPFSVSSLLPGTQVKDESIRSTSDARNPLKKSLQSFCLGLCRVFGGEFYKAYTIFDFESSSFVCLQYLYVFNVANVLFRLVFFFVAFGMVALLAFWWN